MLMGDGGKYDQKVNGSGGMNLTIMKGLGKMDNIYKFPKFE